MVCVLLQTLCIERTTLRLTNKLPGILRWFEVAERSTVVLSPIEADYVLEETLGVACADLPWEYRPTTKLGLEVGGTDDQIASLGD